MLQLLFVFALGLSLGYSEKEEEIKKENELKTIEY